jgi:hypothetical protein
VSSEPYTLTEKEVEQLTAFVEACRAVFTVLPPELRTTSFGDMQDLTRSMMRLLISKDWRPSGT